jgi:hypothetical protein
MRAMARWPSLRMAVSTHCLCHYLVRCPSRPLKNGRLSRGAGVPLTVEVRCDVVNRFPHHAGPAIPSRSIGWLAGHDSRTIRAMAASTRSVRSPSTHSGLAHELQAPNAVPDRRCGWERRRTRCARTQTVRCTCLPLVATTDELGECTTKFGLTCTAGRSAVFPGHAIWERMQQRARAGNFAGVRPYAGAERSRSVCRSDGRRSSGA